MGKGIRMNTPGVPTAESSPDDLRKTLAPGWWAIEQEFGKHYTAEPERFPAGPGRIAGNPLYLELVLAYEEGDVIHFVTVGFSDVYQKTNNDPVFSGCGFELTLKLKISSCENLTAEKERIVDMLQGFALGVWEDQLVKPYELIMNKNNAVAVAAKQRSDIAGFFTIPDTTVQAIHTPFGRVEFVELVGATMAELTAVESGADVIDLSKKLGSDITDYKRQSIRLEEKK